MAWDNICATMTQEATMVSVRISAITTYVTWCEEHLWNVSVHQTVHLSDLVFSVSSQD
jgi:hypothetical protein